MGFPYVSKADRYHFKGLAVPGGDRAGDFRIVRCSGDMEGYACRTERGGFMSNSTLAIQVEGLTKIYGSGNLEVVAMRDVSFAFSNGEVVALCWVLSGAGKSTLLTIVGLINKPTSGKITIGNDLVMDGPLAKVNLRSYRRKFVGYVLQKANLIPFLTGLENVQLALEINDISGKQARRRSMELLEDPGVDTTEPTICLTCCRVASSNEWPSPEHWPTSPASFWEMNPRQPWIVSEVARLWNSFAPSPTNRELPSLLEHTTIAALDVFDRIMELEDGALRSNHKNSPEEID